MSSDRPLFVPVLLGTARQGRASEAIAKLLHAEISKRKGVETALIDAHDVALQANDEGEAIKDQHFSSLMMRADALVIVAPEYNHGYPGTLKRLLDSNLKEYIHKAVGICGVSAGPFGGARVIENLLPVLRELGLVTIFWDVNFSRARNAFDESGNLLDHTYIRRIDKFLNELFWMAKVLRHGRENISLEAGT